MFTIQATARKDQGKGSSRRLRTAGKIPAIVYGGNQHPRSIVIEHDTTWNMQEKEGFYKQIITLVIDGKENKVIIQAVEHHPFKRKIKHIDFLRYFYTTEIQ
ncbi:50S ribosomal protein L25 [Candidatus Profftia lariciata]|uniref:50S ribosomal protein L25 n=1 Tax=Candidatus Profftia lariciata TaxID=1987921 RepID=UPI001D02C165|nr:50S ribosomal protein L25 [Candidatus Profftia lariciata]UDG81690.1 50S ribosomal protein L25 [Candidatus Profftia lariciata]